MTDLSDGTTPVPPSLPPSLPPSVPPALPLTDLDPVLTAPKRLAIVAVLAASRSTDFGFLRDHLGISDSDLSKQVSALEQAGYLVVSRTGRGRGSTTSFRITRAGRDAFTRHRATLRTLLGD